jgi:hypothetical protein
LDVNDLSRCDSLPKVAPMVTPPAPSVAESGWIAATPLGTPGPGRNCMAFVADAGSTYRYNSVGCYYNPADGNIYACSWDTSIRCGWTCSD